MIRCLPHLAPIVLERDVIQRHLTDQFVVLMVCELALDDEELDYQVVTEWRCVFVSF